MAAKRKAKAVKKLTKDSKNKMVSGVLSGLADYLNIDTTLLRLIFAFCVVFTGLFPGLVLYIVAALIMPER